LIDCGDINGGNFWAACVREISRSHSQTQRSQLRSLLRNKRGKNCPFFLSRFSQWIHVPGISLDCIL